LNKKHLDAVEEWLGRRLYKLESTQNTWEADSMAMTVRYGTTEEKYARRYHLPLLLHECGHVESSRLDALQSKRIWTPPLGLQGSALPSDEWYIQILSEESRAWDLGYDISRELSFRIPKESFVFIRNSCLRTYMKWAYLRGKFDHYVVGPSNKNSKRKKK
jgi:hypothetical protein